MRFGFFALVVLLVLGCHSEDVQKAVPAEVEGTKIVISERLDAAKPDCSIHVASDSFAEGSARPAGTVRVEGDYTRILAKVSVDGPGLPGGAGSPVWSGTFSGPRDAFFEMLRGHVCTASRVYALKPNGNKDPSRGPVVLAAFEMTPDEKADIDALCHAISHADAGDPELRDRAAMQWVEDVLTTPTWDAWRRTFARSRGELYARKESASSLFHARGAELEAAASGFSPALTCPTAVEWKKR